jgi:hypothetical protein
MVYLLSIKVRTPKKVQAQTRAHNQSLKKYWSDHNHREQKSATSEDVALFCNLQGVQ